LHEPESLFSDFKQINEMVEPNFPPTVAYASIDNSSAMSLQSVPQHIIPSNYSLKPNRNPSNPQERAYAQPTVCDLFLDLSAASASSSSSLNNSLSTSCSPTFASLISPLTSTASAAFATTSLKPECSQCCL